MLKKISHQTAYKVFAGSLLVLAGTNVALGIAFGNPLFYWVAGLVLASALTVAWRTGRSKGGE